ncbi:MAG: MotE family protein [Bacteroidales bacterium]
MAAPSKSNRPKAKAAEKPQRTPFVRILPLLIIGAGIMLSVRVNDIRKGFLDGGASLRVANELQAQQPEPKAPPPPAPPAQTAPARAANASAPAPATAATAPPPPPPGGTSDPGALSQTEMDVLQKLTERRNGLDSREKDIERREAMLKAAEDQIERKISEMRSLQNTIEALLRQYNDQEDNKMRSLVKIYENMKPKEAAKIFEQLDMPIMLEVVERMKEQKVAPILAEMDPAKARTITSELAQRRQIPTPKPMGGG